MLDLAFTIARGFGDLAIHGTMGEKFTLAALSVMLLCSVLGIICALASAIEVERMQQRCSQPAPRPAREFRYHGPR